MENNDEQPYLSRNIGGQIASAPYAIAFANESWHFPDCDKFQEQLLYDFSLTAGDTVNGCLHSVASLPPIIVDSVGIGFYWGKDRNVLATEMGAMLEGFGTASGPLVSLYTIPTPGNPFLLVDYCIGSDLECGFSLVDNTDDLVKENQFLFYPNPSSAYQSIKVECPSDVYYPLHLTVFNPLGVVVKELTIDQKHGNHFTLNLEASQAGCYTLVIKSQKMTVSQILVIR